MDTPNHKRSSHGGTGFSPACNARQQEKDDLCNLNDRLADYIDKVRSLEAENNRLEVHNTEIQSTYICENKAMKDNYEADLGDARTTLDHVAKGRARLELELGKIRQEHMELKARNSKKEADLETARARQRALEALLNSKDVALTTVLGDKRSLEVELRDFKDQVAKLNGNLADAKKQLQDEVLRRVDAENCLQTANEKLAFQKNIHTEELRQMEKRHEIVIAMNKNGYEQKYESKMAEALNELRAEYEEKLGIYKEEMEEANNSRLENARKKADWCNNRMGAISEDLQQAHEKMKGMSGHIIDLQKQVHIVIIFVRDQDEALSREQAQNEEKEREIRDVQAELQKQEDEFQRLQGVKLSLDMEIITYRKMLEGEEESLSLLRLSLSPKASPYKAKAARTPQSSSTKKRRLSGNDGETSGMGTVTKTHIKQHASASGRITIEEVDLDGKFIRLSNKTDKDQVLTNWHLKRQVASSSPIDYKFPKGFTLMSGGTVTIWAASGGGQHNPPTNLVCRSHQSWGTGKHLYTTLIRDNGEEMAKSCVTCVLAYDNDDDDMESTHSVERDYNLRSRTTISERNVRNRGGPSDDL
ncbi:lamin-A-like [Labrus mixtus]|uniref:lamin-A-like n=1 Tax=Labrus mixtus TaxID=508554 RepID=UPI0029C02D75|nr:lamin-A-like [Labrus mixtus]